MANRARSSVDDWIDVGYELIGDGGPQAVRVGVIAERLGVSRSGFYHRFTDRDALLQAISERWMADVFDVYLRAGALDGAEARLRGIGYFGLGNVRMRRADQWLLVRGPRSHALLDQSDNVRDRAVEWLAPHLIDLGFASEEAERRAYVFYVAYVGLGADLERRPEPPDDSELRGLVDAVVDVVIARTAVAARVDQADTFV